ncbi:hypothetical protein [Pseudofrankia inefficax]|uniref:Uncharacterized protein n=1 Tax=Pseudofrankia inefficax (strain DSM 45817 / CECT 9037 / DDB 130130 / EuI1c) TaxID=298654 RepID=E3J2S3_PSEI1|nr:hypothetical protein [Pseudofrankia inefficax]ADP81734.1 hypothetical protein FraEuI1c_3727 [Pseudofrankia inefficax]
MTLRRPATTLTEPELRSHLRALGDGRPTPGFGPSFPDRIRDGAHRRRTNSRLATAFLLVLLVVGIPVGLLATTRGGLNASPAAATATPTAAPSAVASYGGVSATWLPDGLAHTVDNAVVPDTSPQQGPLGPIRLYRRDVATPGLTIHGVTLAPGMFLSQFTATHTPATTPPTTATPSPPPLGAAAEPGPDLLWITVSWAPPAGGLNTLTDALKNSTPPHNYLDKITTTARTVNGRPAVLATDDAPGLPGWISGQGYNHDALLGWTTPSGAMLTVESITAGPTDLAALQRVADGLVLGTRPPNPTAPPAPDAATTTTVLGVLHDAFTDNVSADRFAAAVQGGDALTATHTALLTDNPQFGGQIEPPTDAEAGRVELVDPNTITAIFNLDYGIQMPLSTAPGAPTRTERAHYYGNATIIHTPTGWQVSRDTFCDAASSMDVEPACPPA